jgi:hypothetical protein
MLLRVRDNNNNDNNNNDNNNDISGDGETLNNLDWSDAETVEPKSECSEVSSRTWRNCCSVSECGEWGVVWVAYCQGRKEAIEQKLGGIMFLSYGSIC